MKKTSILLTLLLVLFLFAMPVAADAVELSENFIENEITIQEELTVISDNYCENMTAFAVEYKNSSDSLIKNSKVFNISYDNNGNLYNADFLRLNKTVNTGFEVVTNQNKYIAKASGGFLLNAGYF